MINKSFKFCGLTTALHDSEKYLIRVYDKIKEEVITDMNEDNEDIEETFEINEEKSVDSLSDKEN